MITHKRADVDDAGSFRGKNWATSVGNRILKKNSDWRPGKRKPCFRRFKNHTCCTKYPNFTIQFPIPSRTLRSAKRDLLTLPNLHGGGRAFSSTASRVWNSHSQIFCDSDSLLSLLNPRWKPIPSCSSTMFELRTLILRCTFGFAWSAHDNCVYFVAQ